jgi:phosphoglucomutase
LLFERYTRGDNYRHHCSIHCCCLWTQVALPAEFVPTPFVAAGVALLGCAAGIMVTASHNTKEYNGYKVCVCVGGLAVAGST